ncbi:hypothetical protein SBA5_220013 [Candidatus Sulfotelmatomonas gaucii]|uniref:Uncharacterized protein n=1 Tax=Candidatus Sulfuritelmatomonas gaucii TaxID=2043161 RepID=A0A2N9L798_9BACT|nr:hypothetical protein SBA5_220013 [Candidatus Sulfotelmatomonas gaucii]
MSCASLLFNDTLAWRRAAWPGQESLWSGRGAGGKGVTYWKPAWSIHSASNLETYTGSNGLEFSETSGTENRTCRNRPP